MIPIKNLYYLLCYAWDRFGEGEASSIDFNDEFENALDLLAFILNRETGRVIRKGLEKGYIEREETLRCVHGRIDMDHTLRHGLIRKGHVRCRFDDLTYDILQNRIIKSTIRRLLFAENLHKSQRNKLRGIYRKLSEIHDIKLSQALFSRIHFHNNNQHYRFLLHICELIVSYTYKLPDGVGGAYRFIDFLRDEKRMKYIFQNFVKNFLAREQKEYKIKSDRFNWPAEPTCPERMDDMGRLPKMDTDISARSEHHTLIIDTKYYAEALKSKFDGHKKVNSQNLYQIYSYVSTMENRLGPDNEAEGLLLYPSNGYDIDLEWIIKDHVIRVKTIDLGLDWKQIHENLLNIIQPRQANQENINGRING